MTIESQVNNIWASLLLSSITNYCYHHPYHHPRLDDLTHVLAEYIMTLTNAQTYASQSEQRCGEVELMAEASR
jgi:hypothetical protein